MWEDWSLTITNSVRLCGVVLSEFDLLYGLTEGMGGEIIHSELFSRRRSEHTDRNVELKPIFLFRTTPNSISDYHYLVLPQTFKVSNPMFWTCQPTVIFAGSTIFFECCWLWEEPPLVMTTQRFDQCSDRLQKTASQVVYRRAYWSKRINDIILWIVHFEETIHFKRKHVLVIIDTHHLKTWQGGRIHSH